MPVRTYPPENSLSYTTAVLRLYDALTCSSSGTYVNTTTTTPLTAWSKRTAVGWDTPGWRKMKNEGYILPFTPWAQFRSEGSTTEFFREWCASPTSKRNKWIDNRLGGEILAAHDAVTLMGLVTPFDLQYLVQKAASGIYTSGWDAATFLAEITQLRRMLTGIGKSFEKLLDLFDPRRTGSNADQITTVANLWLQGRYGWRTLKYDIQDLAGVIASVNERRTRYRQASGMNVSGNYNTYTTSTSSGITSGFSTDISWTGNLRGTVVADIDVPDLQFNPITTAWEVVRLSFVVDWLLNVGQALEASSFLLMAKDYKAGQGYKFDFELNHSTSLVGTTGTTICHANAGSAHGTAEVVSRQPASVSAIPRLQLRLDEYKVMDLLSLVWQRLH